ncbi:hypothetical protein E0H75_07415 [Kribbella capetownensis]|uniref:Uncharacterized protein n=1 Tax=Kribbella capetownensis TaxID=1572659 RepID=A0A4R0KDJ7_9ACTN|nr:hypothetical protein [Kribbella capetownensis]TCC53505.1 hypothetical protein E0H75_07415 [Kribbella capetownensis]
MRIAGFANVDEALAMQETIARVLCPEPEHSGPCEVPWGFSVDGADQLVLGIYATAEKAASVVEDVRRAVDPREVTLTDGTPGRFDDLADQYRIEHTAR